MSPSDVAIKLRAFTADDLVSAYKRGTRDFSRSNLLRNEIEATVQEEQYLDCLDHPDASRYNPLWLDFRDGIERDFDWDTSGRCLSIHSDLPDARNFRGAVLPRINLAGSYLYPVDFSEADLSGADLRGAILIDCSFVGASLRKADLRNAVFDDCDLRGADFYMARMERVALTDCDARKSILRRTKLYRAHLDRVNLQHASLDRAHCDRIVLGDVDLEGRSVAREVRWGPAGACRHHSQPS